MKFVFVITNLAGGGAEKVILTFADGLRRRGHATEIVLLENRVEHAIPDGLSISVLSEHLSRGWLGKRWLAWRLRQYIRAGELPDIVISALPFANEVTILADLRNHWCRIDNNLGEEVDRLAMTSINKANRRLSRYRSLYNRRPLICVSKGVVADLRERIGIRSHIEQVPNPFDFDSLRVAAKLSSADIPERPFVVHVGRFNRQKRHDLLLDAWQLVTTNHLLVLLTTDAPALQVMINERSLSSRVLVVGFQKNPFPWMAKSELLVLTSDYEGLGNVLIEAIACGTRVVSTNCPSGPNEILVGELARWLVPCGDAESLALTIEEALSFPRPSPCAIQLALAPYSSESVLDSLEKLAGTAPS